MEEDLLSHIGALSQNIDALRREIRGAARELRHQRRRSVVLFVLAVIAAITLHDEHIQRCVDEGPRTQEIKRICDSLFPLHEHELKR